MGQRNSACGSSWPQHFGSRGPRVSHMFLPREKLHLHREIYTGIVDLLVESIDAPYLFQFLPRDAMHSADVVAICPPARLSMTRWYSIETVKHIIKHFHHLVATPFSFFHTTWYVNTPTGTPITGASYYNTKHGHGTQSKSL